ncbi:Laccase-3 [Fulvia fulva]|uniref:laccase n=1 Tax=Passalora fulva TaxID=5499 RepID=A0A9Q8P6X0_PASFU|nr:Laccase-3 [Fulvia fulva]KAK4628929.1 Laccase-3 [Fulvia fulva]KAK4630145.1 Laccase-3 [Fulvia fulva]UJO15570.1 Laccase-3 [Fulvia fulva]WPV12135.1 Laccase-3 [Fulvia fulva]WPV27109.1 Laccase-3 [Fulvia fulva]
MRVSSVFNLIALVAPAAFAATLPNERLHLEGRKRATRFEPSRPISFDNSRSASELRRRQSGTVDITFDALVTTAWGESVSVVGSIDALGSWDSANAIALSADQYTADDPLWSATVSLASGTSFSFKYIRIGADGAITWEADPDHFYTVGNNAATISDTWQQASSTTPTTTATSTAPTPTCTNGPTSRGCWSNGLSIETDFDENWPTTGRTVSYDFTITNTTLAPDGFERQGFAINGQYPGPTIYANWGDMISVTVHNEMQNNGTSIHWHGLRLYHSNGQDGVPGVTECPIAPGRSKTYTFQATQYGTSWYHSHFSSQYGDGVLGPIVIYGPATADYDEDLGPLPITDWYYPGIYVVSSRAMHQNALAPTADNGLINGTMVSTSGGAYAQTILKAGKKHRLRLINTAVDNHFQFSLDSHSMLVIAADFVPVVPYNASWVFIGIGQRYDVIITADQEPASYWFRAESQDTAGCGSNFQNGNILSIFSYEGFESSTPESTATAYTQRCTDETEITSYWNSYIPRGEIVSPSSFAQLDTAINQSTQSDDSINLFWQVNGSPLKVDWLQPTLKSLRDGNDAAWPRSANMIELPSEGQWTYWIITEGVGSPFTVNIPHPIHLHGHDFYVLGWGTTGWTDDDAAGLNYDSPIRRDVAMLPTNGWVAIAFQTNNPGAWIMHCHIAWHADEGFSVQFLESKDSMLSIDPLPSDFQSQCDGWDAYYPTSAAYLQSDGGI